MSNNTRGPVAPKDPVMKREGFYVMQEKQISAAPTPDGKGVCFIYEDSGRLANSARLVGNVEDEEILGLMGTVEGFRKLVHSIGVSIKYGDGKDTARFAFQMYGHTDPYVSGTTLTMDIPTDGMEYVYDLSLADWSDDDNIPGQIRFEFDKSGFSADVSVIFYLNDGFKAPKQNEINPIDLESDAYKTIIGKSLMNQGNNARLKRAFEKARSGEDVTVAFIGGSITQGAGAVPINTNCYAYLTFEGLCQMMGKGTDENIHYIKAGVGGTPSELGMLRYQKDVLCDGKVIPDIVVIEFAVNDEGDETKGVCYDSLTRMVYNGPGNPAVILLYAVFSNDWNLEERLSPVGYAYNLPMVSTRRSVVDQFYQTREEGNVIAKSQFFYDCFHPANPGHRIMADGILNMLKIADESEMDEPLDIDNIQAPIGADFEKVFMFDRATDLTGLDIELDEGSFTDKDKDIQCVEKNLDPGASPELPDNWMYFGGCAGDGAQPFVFDTQCKSVLLMYKDSASVTVGEAEVYVDGELKLSVDPHVVGWTHCNALIVINEKETKKHHVEVRLKPGCEDKSFTILGFGIVR